MRADMFEVIIERPRWGHWMHYPRRALQHAWQRSPEEAPRQEGYGRRYREKNLNENLAPLRRYLRSQLGRPWDKVFSEISEQLNVNSAVQKHLLDHLRGFVHLGVRREADGLWAPDSYGRLMRLGPSSHAEFYVCPRSGLLKRVPDAPRTPPKPEAIPLGPMAEARRIGGAWYRLEFAPLPRDRDAWRSCYDQLLRCRLTSGAQAELWRTYGRGDRYAVAKRQLGKRELSQLERS